MKELTIAAQLENMDTVTEFVNAQLEDIGCPMKIQMQIDIVIDELFSNITSYAYQKEEGPVTLQVKVSEHPLAVTITFVDQGIPYDPLAKSDPDITRTAEEREIGGLGIFLVKKTMDHIEYEYKDGKNILTVKKYLE